MIYFLAFELYSYLYNHSTPRDFTFMSQQIDSKIDLGDSLSTEEKNIKNGTPLGKQTRRNEESLKHWKASSVEKTEIIKSERRMKEENRKQRDRYMDQLKTTNTELLAREEMLQEKEKQLQETMQQYLEEQKKRLYAEKELEEVKEQVRASEEKLQALVIAQTTITAQIHQVHLDVSNHLYELHQVDNKEELNSPTILNEELKIDLQIEQIEKDVQCIRGSRSRTSTYLA